MREILFVLILIFYGGILLSQNDTINKEIYSLSLEELLKVKITSVSKNLENVLETPQTVIILTEEQLKQRGYVDLEQIFHDLPGFDISRGNGTQYSQIYQRGYRSNNTERTVFMIDGIEENDLWSNSTWLSRQYPLSNIERIEIIYGPSATVYGANAFLGVVNIITKTADDLIRYEKKFGICSQIGYGTWNTQFVDISMAARTKKISFILTGRIFKSDEEDLSSYPDWDYDLSNYDVNYYKDVLETDNDLVAQTAQQLDIDAYYFSPELNGIKPEYGNQTNDYLYYGKLEIEDLTIGFQTFKRNEGFGAWYRDDFDLGTKNGGRWVPNNTFIYAKYSKDISKKLSINTFINYKIHQLSGECEELYYVGYLNKEYSLTDIADTTGNNVTLLHSDSIRNPYWWHTWWHTYSQQARAEIRMVYKPLEKLNIISGFEIRSSHIQGGYVFSETENPEEEAIVNNSLGGNHFFSRDIGFFIQANYTPIKDLNIVLGGRVDDNKIRLTGGYGTVFNPKAAVVFSPSNFIIKVIYSEAFMDAGYWAKYGTTPGRLLDNPTLKPEKVKNSEISLAWLANKFLYADLVAYNSYYRGAIGTVDVTFINNEGNTVQTTQHQAIGNYNIQGIQSNIYFNYSNYSTYFNYTYTNPYNTTDERIRIGDIASHQVNFGINALFFSRLNLNLRSNWVGEKPTGEETTISTNPNGSIDAYFVLNGAVSLKIYKGISAQILVNNILDKEYFHPGVRSANGILYASKIPQNSRNITVKMNIDF